MKQHLENLTIERFRGLRGLELKEMGQVNLFVGANNSGKTSVLEAISAYCRPLDALEWLSTARRRESTGGMLGLPTRLSALRWLFPQSNHIPTEMYHGDIEIHANGGFAVQSVVAKYQEIRGIPDENTLRRIQQRMPAREADSEYQGAELLVNVKYQTEGELFPESSLQSSFVFWETAPYLGRQRPPAEVTLPVRTITPVSHRTERSQIERFSENTLNKKTSNVLELIRLFDPDILGLQILDMGGGSLYVEHKKSGLTPLSAFGDGLRRVVMIALTLPSVEDGVLLIDEIETAIHISVLNEVFQWLSAACRQYNIQLFATTHSLEAVDALLSAYSKSYNGLVAYQLGQTGEPVKRFSGELLNRLRSERGLDVRGQA
jgi:energy-coupling factor transporter ATP-binding protein EcfA2